MVAVVVVVVAVVVVVVVVAVVVVVVATCCSGLGALHAGNGAVLIGMSGSARPIRINIGIFFERENVVISPPKPSSLTSGGNIVAYSRRM